jgi:hypothetical protein
VLVGGGLKAPSPWGRGQSASTAGGRLPQLIWLAEGLILSNCPLPRLPSPSMYLRGPGATARVRLRGAAVMMVVFVLGASMSTGYLIPGQRSPLQPVGRSRSTRCYGSIEELYTAEDPDPDRPQQRLVRLGAFGPKKRTRSEQETQLEELVVGRWRLVVRTILIGSLSPPSDRRLIVGPCDLVQEESIERPSAQDLKQFGASLKPTLR